MAHMIKHTCIFLLATCLVKFQNPYDAIIMIEIKNGNMYLSSERSLAIISVVKNVLTNHIKRKSSGIQSLSVRIFLITYIIPTKKNMLSGMLELVGGLFHPSLNVEFGYAPGMV